MEVKHILAKGRGVFVNEYVSAGTYMAECKTIYPRSKRVKYEAMYTLSDEPCMILEVQAPQGWQCLDATRKYGTVGHLLNHAAPGKVTVKPYKPLTVMESGGWGFWLSITCSQAQS